MHSALLRFFQSVGWQMEGPGPDGSYTGVARGQRATYSCTLAVDEDLGLLTFYVYCPSEVPPDRRTSVALFLTRANYRMRIGNFEMDLDDGRVRFKSQAIGSGDSMEPERIATVVNSGLSAMDRYFPGLAKTVDGLDPHAAIDEIERPLDT